MAAREPRRLALACGQGFLQKPMRPLVLGLQLRNPALQAGDLFGVRFRRHSQLAGAAVPNNRSGGYWRLLNRKLRPVVPQREKMEKRIRNRHALVPWLRDLEIPFDRVRVWRRRYISGHYEITRSWRQS